MNDLFLVTALVLTAVLLYQRPLRTAATQMRLLIHGLRKEFNETESSD